MNNFGLLVTKNEAPIIAEILEKNTRFMKRIFVLDGGNDGTEKIISRFPEVIGYFHEREFFPEGHRAKDGIRQCIFQKILEHASVGDWVTIMHGDEMFYHDPNESIRVAETLGCNAVDWYAAHFFPHKNDLANWAQLKNEPVYRRFTYYAHYSNSCWIEQRQFRIADGMHYELDRHSGVLPLSPERYRFLPAHPLYHHYKVWDLTIENYDHEHSRKHRRQVARPSGRWGAVHYNPLKWEDFFISKYPKYPRTSRFEGSFGGLAYSYEKLAADTLGYPPPQKPADLKGKFLGLLKLNSSA